MPEKASIHITEGMLSQNRGNSQAERLKSRQVTVEELEAPFKKKGIKGTEIDFNDCDVMIEGERNVVFKTIIAEVRNKFNCLHFKDGKCFLLDNLDPALKDGIIKKAAVKDFTGINCPKLKRRSIIQGGGKKV